MAAVAQRPAIVAPGVDLRPGYRVLALLTRNAALDVYDVWSEERQVRCIAKVVRPDRAHEERVVERLRNEGRVLLALSHPNIVRAYELVGEAEPALILETLSGSTLEALVDSARRPLPVTALAHLMAQLAAALAYVHRHGIVHLDVKPSNIIEQAGQAKLIDFSLARPPGPVAAGVGTRDYRSPEQGRGGYVDAMADVWGLGVTLYEAATDELPFDGGAARAPSIRRLRRLPRGLADVIDACVREAPEHRPSLPEVLAVARSLVDVVPPAAVQPDAADD